MNELEVLIDQYRQRVQEGKAIIDGINRSHNILDIDSVRRLATQLSCYRAIIVELEIIQKIIYP